MSPYPLQAQDGRPEADAEGPGLVLVREPNVDTLAPGTGPAAAPDRRELLYPVEADPVGDALREGEKLTSARRWWLDTLSGLQVEPLLTETVTVAEAGPDGDPAGEQDHGADAGHGPHEAFGFQHLDRFAQRCRADAEFVGQLHLPGQSGAHRVLAGADASAQFRGGSEVADGNHLP